MPENPKSFLELLLSKLTNFSNFSELWDYIFKKLELLLSKLTNFSNFSELWDYIFKKLELVLIKLTNFPNFSELWDFILELEFALIYLLDLPFYYFFKKLAEFLNDYSFAIFPASWKPPFHNPLITSLEKDYPFLFAINYPRMTRHTYYINAYDLRYVFNNVFSDHYPLRKFFWGDFYRNAEGVISIHHSNIFSNHFLHIKYLRVEGPWVESNLRLDDQNSLYVSERLPLPSHFYDQDGAKFTSCHRDFIDFDMSYDEIHFYDIFWKTLALSIIIVICIYIYIYK